MTDILVVFIDPATGKTLGSGTVAVDGSVVVPPVPPAPAWPPAMPVAPLSLAPFLAQCVCLDAAGNVMPGLTPLDAGWTSLRAATEADVLPYAKRDFGENLTAPVTGYQTRNSYIAQRGTVVYVQTYDFGPPAMDQSVPPKPCAYGVFDDTDGGDIVIIRQDGHAAYALTQDSTLQKSLQWWMKPGVGATAQGAWTLFGPDAPTGKFNTPLVEFINGVITPYAASITPPAPPAAMNNEATQYRLELMEWPIIVIDGESAAPSVVTPLPTMITEHYWSVPPVAPATVGAAMERNFFAIGLGCVGWQKWSLNAGIAPGDAGRWPDVGPLGAAPPTGANGAWTFNDGRCWTQLVRNAPPGFIWPPPGLVLD